MNWLFEIRSGEWEGEKIQCIGIYNDEEAERMGYDTY